MPQRLARFVRWIDTVYRDQPAFTLLRARLLCAVNIGVLVFVALNLTKVIWLQLPALPGRVLFNLSLGSAAIISLGFLRQGKLPRAGNALAILTVVVVHAFTALAPITLEPAGLAFQVLVIDVVLLLLSLVFASRPIAYVAFTLIVGAHLWLHGWVFPAALERDTTGVLAVIARDGLATIIFMFLLGLTVTELIAAANRRSDEALERTQAMNAQLEELVAQRTQALAAATQRAQEASMAKSEFLANMSHEIRTPLNGVIATAELLQRDRSLSAPAAERVRLVSDSGELLLRLLGDILDFSKIEAGQLTLESHAFHLSRLLSDNLSLLASRATEQGVHLDIEVESGVAPWLQGDSHRLRQVLINLVSNALKFTPSGGRVEVVVGVAAVGAGVIFKVRDTGIGMDAATLARVFERFTQADSSTTRRFGGTGLGLAISSRLVGMMGGRLEAESEPDRGSTFRFTLPLAATAAPADEGAAATESFAPLHRRVLLAEDNAVNRKILTAQLTELGCEVQLAENGEEALQHLCTADPLPEVILMDCHMPKLDGWEATRCLRAWASDPAASERQQAAASLPVLALTAAALPDERARCEDVGMNGFVAKPARLADLHASLGAVWSEVS